MDQHIVLIEPHVGWEYPPIRVQGLRIQVSLERVEERDDPLRGSGAAFLACSGDCRHVERLPSIGTSLGCP